MGHSGSGKTIFSKHLKHRYEKEYPGHKISHLENDIIRQMFCDSDFSEEGRLNQANRMRLLSNIALDHADHFIADFICPTPEARFDYNPDYIIVMRTIKTSKYEDTNTLFTYPDSKEQFIKKLEIRNWDQTEETIKLFLHILKPEDASGR